MYPIVTATQPTFPTSLPIDQDGTDFSYFSTVKFGSSGKELHMLLDTGAASTWVMASDCLSQACQLHNKFGKPNSDTLTTTTKTWKVEYATGKVAGSVVNDTITLAGMDIDLSFGLASDVSDDFLTYPMDGILGLARPRSNELNVPSFLEVLKTEGRLKANVFGMSFQRHSDNTNDGEISFGDWNPAKMEGELTWVDTLNDAGSWEINVDDAGVADEKAGFRGKTAIIDSGTSFILIPPADAKKLHSLMPGVKEAGEEFHLPCSSKDNVTFAFGGVSFAVSPLDYVGEPVDDTLCTSNIIGRQPLGPDRWLIGDVFLKNVYTVFDWDKNRIGGSCHVLACLLCPSSLLIVWQASRRRPRPLTTLPPPTARLPMTMILSQPPPVPPRSLLRRAHLHLAVRLRPLSLVAASKPQTFYRHPSTRYRAHPSPARASQRARRRLWPRSAQLSAP